jgi:hypothetical protein
VRHVIFIRSYHKDAEWLWWCLRSVDKFANGFDKTHVVVPHQDIPYFRLHFPNLKIESCDSHPDDYLGQQSTKMHADLWTGTDCFITYIDSDCFFLRKFESKDLLDSIGRPNFLMTPYKYELVGDAMCWKSSTEKALKSQVAYEFMRRLPFTINAAHLPEFRRWFQWLHGEELDQYIRKQPSRGFSEFNVIGAWLHACKPNDYHWMDTQQVPLPETILRQGWSWGELTIEAKQNMEHILTQ